MFKRRSLTRELLAELCAFGLLHCIAALPLYLLGGRGGLYGALLLLVPYAAMVAARLWVKNAALFLLAHAACLVPVLFVPLGPWAGILFPVLLGMLAVHSVHMRLTGGGWVLTQGFLITLCGLNLFLALAGVFFSNREGISLTATIPLLAGWTLCAALCTLYTLSTARLDQTLKVLEKNSAQPVGGILRANNRLVGLFALLLLAGFALAFFLPASNLLPLVGAALLAGLRWLVGLLPAARAAEDVAEPPAEQPPPADGGAMEASEGNPLLQLLWQILGYIIGFAVVAALLALAGYGLYTLYKRLRGEVATPDGDQKQYIGPDISLEALARPFRRLWGRLPRFAATEAGRVRRAYYKAVRAEMKKGLAVKETSTPEDIARQARDTEGFDELTARYEAARYGDTI